VDASVTFVRNSLYASQEEI